jgi:hypothetical protein
MPHHHWQFTSSGNMTKSAFSMLDMMMNMQRLGLQAVSAYQPLVSAFPDSTSAAERATRLRFDAQRGATRSALAAVSPRHAQSSAKIRALHTVLLG